MVETFTFVVIRVMLCSIILTYHLYKYMKLIHICIKMNVWMKEYMQGKKKV